MEIADIIKLIETTIWPITIIALICLFKKEINLIFKRIEKASLPGGVALSFGNSKIDKPKVELRTLEDVEIKSFKKDKVANIYWLGHDIMWTMDVILRGATCSTIKFGLQQIVHHLKTIYFENNNIIYKLESMNNEITKYGEAGLNNDIRDKITNELRYVADQIGLSLQEAQRDFIGYSSE